MALSGWADGVRVAGGLGAFLFSWRLLVRLLSRSTNRNFRSTLLRAVSSPARCLILGATCALVLHSTSMGNVVALSLVAASQVTPEQGFLLALGAGLGGALHLALPGWEPLRYGALLLGFSGLLLIVARRDRFRNLLDATGIVGLGLSGLYELGHGVQTLTQSPEFLGALTHVDGTSLSEHLSGVLAGIGTATLIQSSSGVVKMAAGLVRAGSLGLPAAYYLSLGAVLGPMLILLLASLEFNRETRRVALAVFLARSVAVGVFVALSPQLLDLAALGALILGPSVDPLTVLVLIQILLHLSITAVCGLLPYPVMRMASRFVPGESALGGGRVALPLVVRRLFSRSPERCAHEADKQLRELSLLTKNLLDDNLRALSSGRWARQRGNGEVSMVQFDAYREAILDLLIRGMRAEPSSRLALRLKGQLHRLLLDERFGGELFRLRELLMDGLTGQGVVFPPEQLEAHKQFAEALRQLWLDHQAQADIRWALLNDTLPTAIAQATSTFLEDGSQQIENTAWMYSVYSRLRGLAYLLREMMTESHADAFQLSPARGGPDEVDRAEEGSADA